MEENIRIFLHKPNREIVGELYGAYNVNADLEWGQTHKLEFTIPYLYEVDIYYEDDSVNKEWQENRYFNQVREKFLLYIEDFRGKEWYIVDKIERTANESTKEKKVTAYLLPYQLQGTRLFDWKGVLVDEEYKKGDLTLKQIAENVLGQSSWCIRHIDQTLQNVHREFDFSDSDTILSALYTIAEAYNAVIEFDTDEQAIDFRDIEDVGLDLGFFVSYGRLLKALTDEVDSTEIYTKLIPIGKNGIRINDRNLIGTEYLMDYSYYMSPFKRDGNKNVIEHSDYMSDELCHALLDYRELMQSKEEEHEQLLNMYDQSVNKLSNLDNQINNIEEELIELRDTIDVRQSNDEDVTEQLEDEEQLETELEDLQSQYNDELFLHTTIKAALEDLANELSLDTHFSKKLLEELEIFDNTLVWENENIINVEDLIESAKKEFANINMPADKTQIELVDLIEIVKHDQDVDEDILEKIKLGSRFIIHYEQFNKKVNTQIIKMNINYDAGSIAITSANTRNMITDEDEKVAQIIYSSSKASNQYSRNKSNYDKIDFVDNQFNRFLQEGLNAAQQRIIAGANQSVVVDNRGITVTDSLNPNRFIRIMHGIIGISEDGGKSLKLAIDPTGVYAERLVGRLLIGENLFIEDSTGTFNITGNLLTVTDRNDITRLMLGEYENNEFGLKLFSKNGRDVIIDENGILQTWQIGDADNVDSSNGLSLFLYLPDDTLSIRRAYLNFRLLPFRSYSGTTASGGGTSVTSASGGGTSTSTSSGGSSNVTSASGGGTSTTSGSGGGTSTSTNAGGSTTRISATPSSWQNDPIFTQTSSAPRYENHIHPIPAARFSHTHSVSIPSHTHGFSTPNHTHSVSIDSHTHRVDIPSHSHNFSTPNHTHSVTLPNHTHGISHGIYTGTTATNVGIIINGTNRTSALGGSFTSDQENLDITRYMRIGQWNEIRLTSSRLGRINADMFIQAFVNT